METGKVKSYIFYGIGEIFLVVVGILIALQINNWNERYKDEQLEVVYYHKLLEDVNQDQSLLEELERDNNARIKSNNELIHLLQQERCSRENVATKLRETIFQVRFRFRPSLSAFEDLKSIGKLNILTDLRLKKQLLNYYAVMEGYADILDLIGDASLSVHNNPAKNFNEIGFQDVSFVKNEIDTMLVDVAKLKTTTYPSAEIRQQLLSDAVFHLSTNARKKQLLQTMTAEIQEMKSTLEEKCKSDEN